MKHVCMVVSNNVTKDARVLKEASTLQDSGYRVTIIGNKFSLTEKSEERILDNIVVLRSVAPLNGIIRFISNSLKRFPLLSYGEGDGGKSEVRDLKRNLILYAKDLIIFLMIWEKIILEAWIARIKVRADIYHVHDLDMLPAGFVAAYGRGKLIYDSHELWTEMGIHSKWFTKFFKKWEGILIRRCNQVITVSNSIADELSERYNIPRPVVVHNCPVIKPEEPHVVIDLSSLLPEESRDKIKFIYQGAYIQNRGLEQFISAFRFVKDDVVFLLQGFGPLEMLLKRMVQEMDLAHKVFFLPPVAPRDVVAAGRIGDVGVISFLPVTLNNKLALPNKVFDYMASGLALCVSDLPELKALVFSLENGLVFNPLDVRDILRVINTFVENSDLIESMKTRSLYFSTTRYNWDIEKKNLLSVYQNLDKEEL